MFPTNHFNLINQCRYLFIYFRLPAVMSNGKALKGFREKFDPCCLPPLVLLTGISRHSHPYYTAPLHSSPSPRSLIVLFNTYPNCLFASSLLFLSPFPHFFPPSPTIVLYNRSLYSPHKCQTLLFMVLIFPCTLFTSASPHHSLYMSPLTFYTYAPQ